MANVPSSFKTPVKGTELPLLNLRGKMYLQVMHRLIWFRETYPSAAIKTQLIEKQGEGKDTAYTFRAEIYLDTERGAQLVATGHKRETVGDFPDAMEKAEQGAVGRALNFLGFGTQFAALELDEGSRLADSPAPVVEKTQVMVSVGQGSNGTGSEALTSTLTQGATTTKRPSFRKNLTVTTPATGTGDDI